MTWLERILATECAAHKAKPRDACFFGTYFCASRIAAAEGAARAPASVTAGHTWVGVGGKWMCCEQCGSRRTTGPNGTWSPGPSACPGRRP